MLWEVNAVSGVPFHTWQPNGAAKPLAGLSPLYTHTLIITQGFHGTYPMMLANYVTHVKRWPPLLPNTMLQLRVSQM